MAKQSCGTRMLTAGSKNYNNRKSKVEEMKASGLYSSVTFMEDGGGYVAIQKSRAKHKQDEIDAANLLAKKGYEVILKDESGEIKTPDGYLFSCTFEQRTPTKEGSITIKNALRHAKDKRAEVAVIYSKNHVFSR